MKNEKKTGNILKDIESAFPISCSCGRSYSRETWARLHFDGIQSGYDDRLDRRFYDDLEMRRCSCGSTISLPVRLLLPPQT